MCRLVKRITGLGILLALFTFSGAAAMLTKMEAGVQYFFTSEEAAVYIRFQAADGRGAFVAEQQADGTFFGVIPWSSLGRAPSVNVTVQNLNMKKMFEEKLSLTPEKTPSLTAPTKGAAKKVTDLSLVFSDNGCAYSFTAPGHQAVKLSYSSVSQNGSVLVFAGQNGLFSGELSLPYVYARDLITVTLFSTKNQKLAVIAERKPFTPPGAPEKKGGGALSSVTVCIDPGHQGVPIKLKTAPKMPGAEKKSATGSSGMARGVVRMEEIKRIKADTV